MGVLEHIMHVNGLYLNWPNFSHICNSFTIYCLVIQLLVRLGNKFFRNDTENLLHLKSVIIEFYKKEEKNYREVLERAAIFVDYLANIFLLFWAGMFSVTNPTAWFLSWYTSEVTYFIPIVLPFTDPFSLTGYIINNVLIVFYTMLVYVCFLCGDVFTIFFIYQSVPMIDIFCMKLSDFGKNLIKIKSEKIIIRKKNQKKKFTSQQQLEAEKAAKIAKVELQLFDFIKDFNTYNDYLKSVMQFMELTIFAQMVLNSLATATAIVVMLTHSKVIGFALVNFLIIELFFPCVLSTLLMHQKEKLLNEMFSFPWYELSLSKQKMFLQFIHLVQSSTELNAPIIGKVNMELFTSTMNATYSYLMYLKNLVKLQ